MVNKTINESIIECHFPDVCHSRSAAALRDEVDVFSVLAPHGAEVVGRVVGQLRHLRAVQAGDVEVGIQVVDVPADNAAAAHKEHPAAVGRNDGGSEAALGVGDNTFFGTCDVIDFPQLAKPGSIDARTDKGGLVAQGAGIHAVAVCGQEIVADVVAPDADVFRFEACKEYLFHVRRIDGRIVLRAVGDLAADVAFAGIGAEYLVGFAARLREAEIAAVGRKGEVDHSRAVGALRGAALFVQVFNENVGRIVAGRQVSDVVSARRDVEDAVREPVDAFSGALDLRQADTVGIGRDANEIVTGFFRYSHDRIINLLCRHGDNKG